MNQINTLKLSTSEQDIACAAKIIREGGLVAFPTETVYGLGANALDEKAVADIYRAKGRPSDNPMIVHIADARELEALTGQDTPAMRALMKAFWPGPLTMVVNKTEAVPPTTTGGLDTVAIRMPSSEVARQLISMAGCPIAAPSANLSGRPSPTNARDVAEDMEGRIDAIIWGEDCQVGIESTVVDMMGEAPTILRPGIITPDMIKEALAGEDSADGVAYDKALLNAEKFQEADPSQGVAETDFRPKSPGMKYKHYAPRAEMVIYRGSEAEVSAAVRERAAAEEAAGKKVGTLLFGEGEETRAAHEFFAKLRELDRQGVNLIIAGALNPDDQIGFAVMNRMFKSAGYNVIDV
jgi:L-threonylcarbamoyladenylate synthase